MTPEQALLLREAFPPESIGYVPKGNIKLAYVGHAATTARLIAVDPDWTWEPFATDPNGLPLLDERRNLWIKLTVCGKTLPAVGDGASLKECIGDAIRNGAMRFGVALDLWAKEDLSSIGAEPSAAVETDPLTLAALEDEFTAVTTLEQLTHAGNAVEAAVNMGLLSQVDQDVLRKAYRKAAASLPKPEVEQETLAVT